MPPAGYERLRPYVAFHAALRSAFQAFVHGLEERCKGIVRHHLETATSEYAIGLLAGERAHAAGAVLGTAECLLYRPGQLFATHTLPRCSTASPS
jgi:hypothetical protein